MKGFKPKRPIKGRTLCLVCGCGSHDTLLMGTLLGVGFGDVTVTRDDQTIYSESAQPNMRNGRPKLWRGKDAERLAATTGACISTAPLYEAEYQRQGAGHWPLISKGEGFA